MNDKRLDYSEGIENWIVSQVGVNPSSVEKGNTFCQWVLENIFNLSSDDALDAQRASGPRDHGIDAVINYEEQVIVVQAKYNTSHSIESLIKFHFDMEKIAERKAIGDKLANDEAQRVIATLQNAHKNNFDVKYYYITNSTFTANEKLKIEQLSEYKKSFFCYDLDEIVNIIEERQQDIPSTIKDKWFSLPLSDRNVLTFANTTAVIAVSLADMYQFVEAAGNDLFASNVRQYLKKTKINKAIINTIQEKPEEFWLYNNGITIVCDDFKEEGAVFTVDLKTPQIVNGCQTARSIWEVFSKKNQDAQKDTKGYVLVRIIKDADGKKRNLITKYTNTQNAVRGKDFFSLEDFHKKLQKNLQKLGYYYEIQRGSFTSLKSSELAKYKGMNEFSYLVDEKFKNIIPASEATQAFASAFKGLPAVAYAGSDKLTPTGDAYDTIFDETLQPNAERFLYPYLIRLWAQKNGYGRGTQGGWRAHSALFFVHTYFVVGLEILKKLEIVDSFESNTEGIDLKIWGRILQNESTNADLLWLVDDILERYFGDSKVVEAIGQDVRKFLRSQGDLNRYKSILMRLIDNVILSSPRNSKIIEKIKALVK